MSSDAPRPPAEGADTLAHVVWSAWLDGMLAQGRDVDPERRSWATLSDEDKVLDAHIARMVRSAVLADIERDLPIDDPDADGVGYL